MNIRSREYWDPVIPRAQVLGIDTQSTTCTGNTIIPHAGGHLGHDKTIKFYNKVYSRAYWGRCMHAEIAEYVKRCDACQHGSIHLHPNCIRYLATCSSINCVCPCWHWAMHAKIRGRWHAICYVGVLVWCVCVCALHVSCVHNDVFVLCWA